MPGDGTGLVRMGDDLFEGHADSNFALDFPSTKFQVITTVGKSRSNSRQAGARNTKGSLQLIDCPITL